MRRPIQLLAAIAGVIGLMCLGAAEAPEEAPKPGAAPATRAIGRGFVRGRVTIGGLHLVSPDLSRIVVFLASSPALDAGPTTRASVSQHNKAFSPNFVVVPRATEVEFPNWDTFDHNVFSRSAAAPAFDLDRYPYGESKTRIFDKLGVVQVFCNIHPQMRAVIYVTPNAFFTRADREGHFEIGNIPAGKFELIAWQERCDEQHQAIEVRESAEPLDVSLTLKESRERALNNSDVRSQPAYGVERGLGVKRERLNLPVVTDSHRAPNDSKP
jgi:plastocyanin